MPKSRVVIQTEHASRYLQQLAKHWAHKFETEFTATSARIALPLGEARLTADEAHLSVELISPESGNLAQFQDVLQVHIERFAFKETLGFNWQPQG